MCSDLSAVHGIRDATRLDSATFFTLAYRLTAYQGVIAARAAAQREQDGVSASPGAPVHPGSSQDVRARFRAATSMPVASATELRAITAHASLPGQPAGTITEVRSSD